LKLWLFLLSLLFFLNLADIGLTYYGLSLGATELNPLFFRQTIPVKLGLPIVLAFLFVLTVHYARKEKLKWAENMVKITVSFLVAFYLVIVVWNFLVVFLLSSFKMVY